LPLGPPVLSLGLHTQAKRQRLRPIKLVLCDCEALMQEEQRKEEFVFSYWKLSYRGKFFRTLWTSPVIFIFFLFPADTVYLGMSRNALFVVACMLLILQLAYNSNKWKTSESTENPEAK
jgi:hypothetical protein